MTNLLFQSVITTHNPPHSVNCYSLLCEDSCHLTWCHGAPGSQPEWLSVNGSGDDLDDEGHLVEKSFRVTTLTCERDCEKKSQEKGHLFFNAAHYKSKIGECGTEQKGAPLIYLR